MGGPNSVPAMLWLMAVLGAVHGLNPGMGWLFAVALGLQEQKGSAVARALVPIALGHLLAIGGALLVTFLLGAALPIGAVRMVAGTTLVVLGVLWFLRHRHPRWVRMQVGFRDLTAWSFLVASVHGAGLMVVPLVLAAQPIQAAHDRAAAHHQATADPTTALLATAVHTAGYLAVTGLIAWIVYARLGLAFLRRAWLNVDQVWAGALILAGSITLLA